MAEFIVTDPAGKEHVITAPDGATQEQALEFAKSQFESTAGGAAVGNPNMQKQSKNLRTPEMDAGAAIGGATVLGGAMGAVAPEILTGLGGAAAAFPPTAGAAPFLFGAGQALKGVGRTASAISGAIGGLVGETAGQGVEAAGGPQIAAEAARLAGGAVGGETATLVKHIAETYVKKPALSIGMHLKKMTAKAVLDKMEGKQTLSSIEQKFVDDEIAALRGPSGRTDADLKGVGSVMGDEGQRLLDASDQQMIAAMRQQSQVGKAGAFNNAQPADVGERLRDVITTRNSEALAARSKQFSDTQSVRDLNISNREKAGFYIDRSPEYQKLVSDIEVQINGSQNAPAVKASYQKILDELRNQNDTGRTSFNAVDQVRRGLGDVFRGKPAVGYEAVDAKVAKDLYGRISDLQKKDAGPAQARLLDDYHAATEGMEVFSSKMGKKATALDQYRPEQYATDPSTLPGAYFKTRASVQALKELTGSNKEVNVAALEYANKSLAGKSGPEAKAWLNKNAEWLSEVGPTHRIVAKYVDRLDSAEKSVANAAEFAAKAVADNKILTRQSLPAQRAVDLIKSGDTELWAKVTPAIVQSPQAKFQMVKAVRQVVADQASSKNTVDLFSRNIRPFLEGSGIASRSEMDFIAQKLSNIQEMKIPEPEKLGMARRLLLNSTGTWAATAMSRGGVAGYNYMQNQVPAEQPFLTNQPQGIPPADHKLRMNGLGMTGTRG